MGTTGFEQRIPTWTMGDRLAKARRDTGMSTREFADALGVSAKTINNYEAGTHAPRRIVINAWSLATGVPTGWLLTGTIPSSREADGDDLRARRDSNPKPSDPKVRGLPHGIGKRYLIA